MIPWEWLLALIAVTTAVAGAVRRWIENRRLPGDETREKVDRAIQVPLFAGDRFGDDWGRF